MSPDKDPNHLHPVVRGVLAEHLRRASRYLHVEFGEGYRDEAAQLVAWQKGRDANGTIVDPVAVVTNAAPGQSYHGVRLADGSPCSLAYHLWLFNAGGRVVGFGAALTPEEEMLYTALGVMGEALGMTWGGRWRSRDWQHFEKRIPGLDLATIRQRLTAGQLVLTA